MKSQSCRVSVSDHIYYILLHIPYISPSSLYGTTKDIIYIIIMYNREKKDEAEMIAEDRRFEPCHDQFLFRWVCLW